MLKRCHSLDARLLIAPEGSAMLEVLGIHSNATAEEDLLAGHAWLSMHFTNGRSTTVGLWTTTLFRRSHFVKDSTGLFADESFDVNFGLEAQRGYSAKASRYYKLDGVQSRRAVQVLGHFQSWRFTHTCASWARDVVHELLGEDLDASEFAGATDTPRRLADAISKLERRDPTSLSRPKQLRGDVIVRASVPGSRAYR